MLVLQAAYRRLITPRGTLQGGDEESTYGFDVAQYVGAVGYDIALIALPGQVRGELKKDDRISEVDCVATFATAEDGTISIVLDIACTLSDGSGTFNLTLGVTDVDTTILDLAA